MVGSGARSHERKGEDAGAPSLLPLPFVPNGRLHRRSMSDCGRCSLNNGGGTRKHIEFIGSQRLKRRSETFNSAASALLQQPCATRRRFQPDSTGVLDIVPPSHQTLGLQAGNELRHRRRLNLFDPREFCQSQRACEYENRQSRQPSRSNPGALVLFPDTPQEVDGRSVQGVGDRGRLLCPCM